MKTVHMIFNAHIDPIWLWPWQEGLDVSLATFRSACDLLDRHADLTFCQGEAWVYRQIERLDPELLERVKGHARSGRWEIVGGWWLQPDCNFPGGLGFERQMGLGKEYFEERFGAFPEVAYNIDSFGHAATLPGYMRAAGQRYYVMMRPGSREMALPARLFRWRGFEDGPEVVTFRIAGGYCTGDITAQHVLASVADLPPGVEHTMCFVGLGDHGGGPTERQIEWVRANADSIDGCRLVFSTPSRFFKSASALSHDLPEVTGELQHHAIGCYSVHRPVKTAVRAAEHMLRQAEIVADHDPRPERDQRDRIAQGWQSVCTHHFHDTLGGSCVPSAYPQVEAQLGQARAIADDVMQYGVRRMMDALPDDTRQRVVFYNASDEAFDDYVRFEPWLDWNAWPKELHLVDEEGRVVPSQAIEAEAVMPRDWRMRVLLRLSAAPASMRALRIVPGAAPAHHLPGRASAAAGRIYGGLGVMAGADGRMCWPDSPVFLPRLELIDDPTDTWSHDVDRYGEGPGVEPRWDTAALADEGPLMASLVRGGTIGGSRLLAETRVYADLPVVELILRVDWIERHKVLKLVLPLEPKAVGRRDGIPGGHLCRPLDGAERPLRDWTLLDLADGKRLGVVCPDAYALDAAAGRARLTLLRSPMMAHDNARPADALCGRFADQGPHEFRFRFYRDACVTPGDLDRAAMMLHQPLIRADLTRGMGSPGARAR